MTYIETVVVYWNKKIWSTLHHSPITPSRVVAPSTESDLSYSVDGATTYWVIADMQLGSSFR